MRSVPHEPLGLGGDRAVEATLRGGRTDMGRMPRPARPLNVADAMLPSGIGIPTGFGQIESVLSVYKCHGPHLSVEAGLFPIRRPMPVA